MVTTGGPLLLIVIWVVVVVRYRSVPKRVHAVLPSCGASDVHQEGSSTPLIQEPGHVFAGAQTGTRYLARDASGCRSTHAPRPGADVVWPGRRRNPPSYSLSTRLGTCGTSVRLDLRPG